MSVTAVLTITFAATLSVGVAFWLLSLRLRDASIVDIFWGYGFGLIATLAFALSPAQGSGRSVLLLGAVLLWSLRLGTHLLVRSHGRPEDFRYRDMRGHHGEHFGRRSLYTVFILQAVVQWALSLTLQLPLLVPGAAPLGILDAIGTGVFLAGFLCEAIADWQLERFRRLRTGGVLAEGLWRYSRHPNYFGDWLLWCGFAVLGLSTPWGPWGVLGPAVLGLLLLRVSGVPLMERGLGERLPGYRDYVARTPGFVPGFRPRV